MGKSKKAVQKKISSNTVETELKSALEFTKTTTDQMAGFTIYMLGSIKFLIACITFFIVWICWNLNFIPGLKPFDTFPFPILEMVVSIFAIILSVSVLINQNRQSRIDKIKQQIDFEINVRAEEEITKLLNMVHEIHQKLGIKTETDKELEAMKEMTDIQEIHKKIDEEDIVP